MSSSSAANVELQRLWLDARCAPLTSSSHEEKLNAFLSFFLATFQSRRDALFQRTFGSGVDLAMLLCKYFAQTVRRTLSTDKTNLPQVGRLDGCLSLTAQALTLLVQSSGRTTQEVAELVPTLEVIGTHNVVALSLLVHTYQLQMIERYAGLPEEVASLVFCACALLELVYTVLSVHRRELIRRSAAEASTASGINAAAATAQTLFVHPIGVGEELVVISGRVLRLLLSLAPPSDAVKDCIDQAEATLEKPVASDALGDGARCSLASFTCLLENVVAMRQYVGFLPEETVNFNAITATVLRFEQNQRESCLPLYQRILTCLRVLAETPRPASSSPTGAENASGVLSGSFFGGAAGLLRGASSSLGKIHKKVVHSLTSSTKSDTADITIPCRAAFECLTMLFALCVWDSFAIASGQLLFELASTYKTDESVVSFALGVCKENLATFSDAQRKAALAFVSGLPYSTSRQGFLRSMMRCLGDGKMGDADQEILTIDFLSLVCGRDSAAAVNELVSMGALRACVAAVERAIDAGNDKKLEALAERFSVFAKVAVVSSDTLNSLREDGCANRLLVCMKRALRSGQDHAAVILRDVFAQMVVKTGGLLDVLLGHIAKATETTPWGWEVTPLLSTLVTILQCSGRGDTTFVRHNGIELCLSMMPHLERGSKCPVMDLHLLGSCLSFFLTLVTYSDVWNLFDCTVGTLAPSRRHAQFVLDLSCGLLRHKSSVQLATRYFASACTNCEENLAFRASEASFSIYGEDSDVVGGYHVPKAPFCELIHPLKSLVAFVDAMRDEEFNATHKQWNDAAEMLELLLQRSGVRVPNVFLRDYILKWRASTLLFAVMDIADPELHPLLFAENGTSEKTLECQEAWKHAVPKCAEDLHGNNSYLLLGDCGGASGYVSCSSDVWPPADGFSTCLWVSYTTAMCPNKTEHNSILWQLQWSQTGTSFGVTLSVDPGKQCTFYSCQCGEQIHVLELPFIAPGQSICVVTVHSRDAIVGSTLKVFFNGLEVVRCSCPYPARGLKAASMVTAAIPGAGVKQVHVVVGSPKDVPNGRVAVHFTSLQVYAVCLTRQDLWSLYAIGPHMCSQTWSSSGQQSILLTERYLEKQALRAVVASQWICGIGEISSRGTIQLDAPPAASLLLHLHAGAMERVDATFDYLNNKQWTLVNLASPHQDERLHLYGHYLPPQQLQRSHMDALLAHGALQEWSRWMDCIAVCAAPEERTLAEAIRMAGNLLDIVGRIAHRTYFSPRVWRMFSSRLLEHILRTPKAYLTLDCHCLPNLLALSMFAVRHTDSEGKEVNSADDVLLSNISPLHDVLFNWHALDRLPLPCFDAVLQTFHRLTSPYNRYALFNGCRMWCADIINGFVLGMFREYVPLRKLVAATEYLKGYLIRGVGDAQVYGEVLTICMASVPAGNSSDDRAAVGQRLSTKMACHGFDYIVLVRNLVLKSLCDAVESAEADERATVLQAVASVAPGWWFAVMVSGHSHPITAALALRLFMWCFLNCTKFRDRFDEDAVEALGVAAEEHCHQPELLDIAMHGFMGGIYPLSSSHMPFSAVPQHCSKTTQKLLPLVLRIIRKQSQIVLRKEPVSSALCSIKNYFAGLGGDLRVASSSSSKKEGDATSRTEWTSRKWKVLLCVVRICTFVVTRKDASSAEGTRLDSGAEVARVRSACVLPSLDLLKAAIAEAVACLAQLYKSSVVVQKFMYRSNMACNWVDSLVWPLLASLQPTKDLDTGDRRDVIEEASTPNLASPKTEISPELHEDDEFSGMESASSSDEEWEMLPAVPTLESRSWGLDSIKAKEGMEDLYDACRIFYLAHACLREGSTESVVMARGQTKILKYVLTLHRALSAELRGSGSQTEDVRCAFLCSTWLKAAEQAVDAHHPSADPAQVAKNVIALGKYTLDRLVSGLAAPPAAIAHFFWFLLVRLDDNVEVVKTARTALYEWAMYIMNSSFYRRDAHLAGNVVEMLHDCRDVLLSTPMPATDMLKVLVKRLLELTYYVAPVIAEEPNSVHRKLAALWSSVVWANRGNSCLPSLCGRGTATDLFSSGFDILLSGQPEREIIFLRWVFTRRAEVWDCAQLIKVEFVYTLAEGGKYLKLAKRSAGGFASHENRHERSLKSRYLHHTQCRERATQTSTFLDPGLVPRAPAGLPQRGAMKARREEWFLHVYGTASQIMREENQSADELFADPLDAYLRHPPPLCLPICSSAFLLPTSSCKLCPNALQLLSRVTGRRPDASIEFVGNAYYVVGTESYICTVSVTQLELVVITCSEVTKDGDFFIEQTKVRTAMQQSSFRSGFIQQAFKRFLTGGQDGARAGGTDTPSAFRYSQYYRQLRTEEAAGMNSLVWRVPLGSIGRVEERLFQHLPVGLEFALKTGERFFLVLLDEELSFSKTVRNRLFHLFEGGSLVRATNVVTDSIAEKRARLGVWTQRWAQGRCSNFGYLTVLNDAAARTAADIGQYPVMPWVLQRYNEEAIDLQDGTLFRDFSKPVGAMDSTKAAQLQRRYSEWIGGGDAGTAPYHYGTHYSSAAIVLHYLLRLQPHTWRAIKFQGGKMDIADRLFHSVSESWTNSSGQSSGDVKELIPEFYCVPDFLCNRNNLNLGTRSDGTALGEVALPPWAASDPLRFVLMNRLALECDLVSQQLHNWIDLIFGYKQLGAAAVEAVNVFHPLSYRDGVFDAIGAAVTEESRKSVVATADNFGQTPTQLFQKTPHAKKMSATDAACEQDFLRGNVKAVTLTPTSVSWLSGFYGAFKAVETTGEGRFGCTNFCQVSASSPSERFRYNVITDSIHCALVQGGRCVSVIAQISSAGFGTPTCLRVSESGNIVCVGMSSGAVVVYGRDGVAERFAALSVLHRPPQLLGAGAVRDIFMLEEGSVVASFEGVPCLASWRTSCLSTALCFAASYAAEHEAAPIRDLTQDTQLSLLYAVTDYAVLAISRQGHLLRRFYLPDIVSVLSQDPSAALLTAPLTTAFFFNCNSFSTRNILLLGHANGLLSLWQVRHESKLAASTDVLPIQLGLLKYVSLEEEIACLSSTVNAFTVCVGLASGKVYQLAFPLSTSDGV